MTSKASTATVRMKVRKASMETARDTSRVGRLVAHLKSLNGACCTMAELMAVANGNPCTCDDLRIAEREDLLRSTVNDKNERVWFFPMQKAHKTYKNRRCTNYKQQRDHETVELVWTAALLVAQSAIMRNAPDAVYNDVASAASDVADSMVRAWDKGLHKKPWLAEDDWRK